jgi:hypothetical protein
MYKDGHLELHDTKGTKSKRGYRAENDAVVKERLTGEMFVIPIRFWGRERNGE